MKHKSLHNIPAAFAALGALAISGAALAQENDVHENEVQKNEVQGKKQEQQGRPTAGNEVKRAPNPYARLDDSWITISGTVSDVTRDSFTLDYGPGTITVEMDDGDRDADGYKLMAGDDVRVAGRIDDDLFEMTKIEASSVYVEKLDTYFYASSIDEEDYTFATIAVPVTRYSSVVTGVVTSIEDDSFTMNTGTRAVDIDVDNLPGVLDNDSYRSIEIGDVVSVTGEVDYDFFEGREIEADSLTTLYDQPG